MTIILLYLTLKLKLMLEVNAKREIVIVLSNDRYVTLKLPHSLFCSDSAYKAEGAGFES